MDKHFYLRYCGSYLLTNFLASVALIIVFVLIKWDVPGSFAFVIAMISASMPAHLFVKDHARRPEKAKYAILQS